VGKVIVLVLGVGFLVTGAVFATKLEANIDPRWFVPDDGNYIVTSQKISEKYFESSDSYHAFFIKEGDYFAAQSEITTLNDKIPSVPYVHESSVFSWHSAFNAWQNNTVTAATYVSKVHEFLETPDGSIYKDNVLFSNDNSSIIATRILYLSPYLSAQVMIEVMDAARDIAGDVTKLNVIAYDTFFIVLDGLKVMKEELFRNLFISGSVVFVVIALLLAHIPLSALVLVMVAMIDIELLGFAYVAGYSYNAVTVINCLVTVGLAVDYNAHIAHSFYSSSGTRDERAHKALHHIGGAVLCGGITTFLAVLPLSLATNYIFQVFFDMMAFMIAIALFHGLCVLPVLLSLVGPMSGGGADRMDHHHSRRTGQQKVVEPIDVPQASTSGAAADDIAL